MPGYIVEQLSVFGKILHPVDLVLCCGVSKTSSSNEHSGSGDGSAVVSSPHVCFKFNQWPTSCVAVLPRLYDGSRIPILPNAL
jgi:hypothetical protein